MKGKCKRLRNDKTKVSRYTIFYKLHTVCWVLEVSLVAGCRFCEGCWFLQVLAEPVNNRGKHVLSLPPAAPSSPQARFSNGNTCLR